MKKSIAFKCLSGLLVIYLLFSPSHWALAQQGETEGPIYIVQEGDSLWDIALRFRVSIDDLTKINGITDPNQLTVGFRLIIPGLQGVQGVLTTKTVSFGDNLKGLSRRYNVPIDLLVRLNHLTTPAELYAGANLVVPESENGPQGTTRASLLRSQSLLEIAVLNNTNPWDYITANHLSGTWSALPGDVMHLPSQSESENGGEPSGLPADIKKVQIAPMPFVQGEIAKIRIEGQIGSSFGGSLNEYSLNFFEESPGSYISLQGIHAMIEPGLYTMILTGTLQNSGTPGNSFSYSQAVFIESGDYFFDPVLIVSPETIDPAVTTPENAQWAALAAPITAEKLWEGIFQSPAPEPFQDCWPSLFGSRRSYNGSAYIYFHSGLDFCGGVGTEIRAPAAGVVIFAGPLTVRGNATMINHGWGVYTGYMHQSEISVNVGDRVEKGQLIGLVGGTGRVTGPHLHWEVWVGGVQVNPLEWLEKLFPGD